MKVIADTNVLISGLFFGGVPGRLVDAWLDGRFDLLVSPSILAEYQRVGQELAVKYPARTDVVAPLLTAIAVHAIVVDDVPLPAPVSADPADDMFLAAALRADAALIVSGDRHLLDVTGWHGIEVVTPRVFVDRHVRRR